METGKFFVKVVGVAVFCGLPGDSGLILGSAAGCLRYGFVVADCRLGLFCFVTHERPHQNVGDERAAIENEEADEDDDANDDCVPSEVVCDSSANPEKHFVVSTGSKFLFHAIILMCADSV